MRPDIDIVDQHDVDSVDAEAQRRLLERAHGAVIGIVEAQAVRHAAAIARAVAAPGEGLGDAADLGRDHHVLATRAPQRRADAVLGEAVAIERGGVDQADAGGEGCLDRRDCARLVEVCIEIAERRAAETKRRDLKVGAAERSNGERGSRHRKPGARSRCITMCTSTC
jgi:hypothetical protein